MQKKSGLLTPPKTPENTTRATSTAGSTRSLLGLGVRDEQPELEREHALVPEALRHAPGHDALREALRLGAPGVVWIFGWKGVATPSNLGFRLRSP